MSESRQDPCTGECRACELLLAAYVDGEAPARDRHRVEQHTQSCAGCRDWLEREQAVHAALRARRARLRACAPEHLRARCAAHAAPDHVAAPPRAVSPAVFQSAFRRWVPLSVAATVIFAVAAVFALGLNSKVQALAVQSTVDHVKCSRFHVSDREIDAVSAAQQWQARFGWPLRLPASAGDSGLQLRAVRRCAVTDGRVAHLIYSWMGEPLSVYVLPKRTLGDVPEFVHRFRHQSVMWSQNDRTYIIVTSRPHDAALEGVVAYVRAAAY